MLTIESIDLRPGFRSLLRGEIVLRDLYLRGARLRLENGPGGRGNWQFDAAEGKFTFAAYDSGHKGVGRTAENATRVSISGHQHRCRVNN